MMRIRKILISLVFVFIHQGYAEIGDTSASKNSSNFDLLNGKSSSGGLKQGSSQDGLSVNGKGEGLRPSDNSTKPSTGSPGVSSSSSLLDTQLDGARYPSTIPNLVCEKLQNSHPSLADAASKLVTSCNDLQAADKSCFGVFEKTNQFCHTENNESIANSITMIQSLMSVASGVTNACNNFAKAMDIAKKAMTAYTTACTAAQLVCDSKCAGTVTKISAFAKQLESVKVFASTQCIEKANLLLASTTTAAQGHAMAQACTSYKYELATMSGMVQPELQTTPLKTVASKAKICRVSVPAVLGTAIINIGSLAQSKAQADQCKKESEAEEERKLAKASCDNIENKDRADCACNLEANKNRSYCLNTKDTSIVDCGLTENTSKPICICRANPRMTGCEGVSTALTTNSTLKSGNGGTLSGGRGPSGTNVNSLGGNAADGSGAFSVKGGNGTDGSSAAGGGSYGSSAGLGGGGAGSDSAASKTSGAESGLGKDAANILDSGAGGGAGGAGFRYSASDYNSPEYRSKLKAFADKNGIGKKIAGSSWTDQVTSVGGKSNFDKVKVRYQENKSTLLNK